MNKRQNQFKSIPARYVQQRISFLFQAELSIDRCKSIQELRAYYARIWPRCSIDALLAAWPEEKAMKMPLLVNMLYQTCIGALMQWFVFRRICLSASLIKESEDCLNTVMSILRGSDIPTKESLIPVRMNLNSVATSLCGSLPSTVIQAFRNIEHLNSAPHLSLRPFHAGCRCQQSCP